MIIIGITGLIASGKTSVATMFAAEGVPSFNADDAVHELYSEKEILESLAKIVPDAVHDGMLDRKILSQIAHDHPEILLKLEELIHPMVRDKMKRFVQDNSAAGKNVVLLDVPLLYEGGLDKICNYVVCTKASDSDIKERFLKRPNSNLEKLEIIIAKQKNYDKEKLADYIVDTSQDLSNTKHQVKKIVLEIKNKHA